jgi:hypothetical protein
MPTQTVALRITLEHSEFPEIQFSQFFSFPGYTDEHIARLGFGSGTVRGILGYDFGNRLIELGFTNVTAQIREHNPRGLFRE